MLDQPHIDWLNLFLRYKCLSCRLKEGEKASCYNSCNPVGELIMSSMYWLLDELPKLPPVSHYEMDPDHRIV